LAALAPAWLRYEDASATGLPQAFAAHQAREASQTLGLQAMSRLSASLLALADPAELAHRRQANHACLWRALPAWAPQGPADLDHAPLGLAVTVPASRRSAIRAALHAQSVFTAVYWPELPSPAAEFPADHARAAATLVLPCDQRWGSADMLRVADCFVQACRAAA
jgi:hypothetical protein